MVCVRCGKTGDAGEFIKPRPQRRPRCRACDNEQQREWRYQRGARRRIGEVESYTCTSCGCAFETTVSAGAKKGRCDPCVASDRKVRMRGGRYRAHDLKRKYGLTPADFEAMLQAQSYRCAICGTDDPGGRHGVFQVDHDHKTAAVRELLCGGCNRGLGFYDEDPARLRAAAAYIEYHGARAGRWAA